MMLTTRESLFRLAEDLAEAGWADGFLCNNASLVNHFVSDHRPLPKRTLPGRIIKDQPPEVREQIKLLKAEHFQHRIK
jgi:hypothetical protein